VVDNSSRPTKLASETWVTLEASCAGLSGIVIWGLHRDTTELQVIRLPVFSLGALPAGPQRLDPQDSLALSSAACGKHILSADDFVVGDDNAICVSRCLVSHLEMVNASLDILETRQEESTLARRAGWTSRAPDDESRA
jgi:regulator of RNase E activity RraA